MAPQPVLVSWSSGKDSAWALHTLREQPERYDVRGVFTTVNARFDRVAIQAVPGAILRLQAERLGLPLYEIPLPYPCPNEAYEAAMRGFLERVRALPDDLAAETLAFGDLFLEDVRGYREEQLRGTGFTPIFPIWGEDTGRLAERMIDGGLRAIITALNPAMAPASLAGRWFDRELLADLPEGVDPLGENGEFHTCALAGPMFPEPIAARPGRIVERAIEVPGDDRGHDGPDRPRYVYADVELLPS